MTSEIEGRYRRLFLPRVGDPVVLLLTLLAITACLCTSFMSHAPNRLADGVAYSLWHAPRAPVCVIGAILGALLGASLRRPSPGHALDVLALSIALVFATLVAAGTFAALLTEAGHPAQRQALGVAFWCLLVVAALVLLEAMEDLGWGLAARALVVAGLASGVLACASVGLFDALSITREAASHRAAFIAAFLRHVELVSATIVIAVVVCAPLIAAVRHGAWRGPIFATLGLLQTIPSIALFGLLIAPLGFLAAHVPALKAIGVSGLGVTPTLVALVLYSAFPLVRMGDAAFAAVPSEVRDAARGLGYGPVRRVLAVDIPLAVPVLLSGLRVVTLQAIGLATIAALIGGGGLGTFVFEGIGQYALDLVLIGAIPVILLALAADFAFRLLLALSRVPA